MINKVFSLLTWIILVVGFIAIQFIPVQTVNPPVTETVPLNEDVEVILKKACFDCHSNETRYPWYAHVAPVSFLLRHHIREARSYVNFSTWDVYPQEKRQELLSEVIDVVSRNDMPLFSYTLIHQSAKLNEVEKDILIRWAGEIKTFIPSSMSDPESFGNGKSMGN